MQPNLLRIGGFAALIVGFLLPWAIIKIDPMAAVYLVPCVLIGLGICCLAIFQLYQRDERQKDRINELERQVDLLMQGETNDVPVERA